MRDPTPIPPVDRDARLVVIREFVAERLFRRPDEVTAERSAGGYRLYGPAQLQRLRTLKELLAGFDIALSDVAFASRMATDPQLRESVQSWLAAQPRRPEHVSAEDWLRFEQEKHERLLAA